MWYRTLLFACACSVAVAGCASGPAATPAGAAAPAATESVGDGGFPLQPGDVIRLRIWREPDLSGEFSVDESGVVMLPKIGAVTAAELTPAELEATVRSSYERYLRNPSIEVVPLRRVNILGAVRIPGLYPVDPTMTLRDAVALAGGVLPHGRQDRVELIRGEIRLVTQVTGDTRIEDLGIRSGDQVYVPERSWIHQNAGVVAGVASTLISASVALIIAFKQ